MPNFATWLHQRPATDDPGLGELKTFAAGTTQWPYWSDRLADYLGVIGGANPQKKDALIATLAEQYARWQVHEPADGQSRVGSPPSANRLALGIATGAGLSLFVLVFAALGYFALNGNAPTEASFDKFDRIAGGASLLLFALIVALLVYRGLNNSTFYTSLAQPEQVRGFITFLFVICISVIIILIAISIFWMKNSADVDARFQHAKDLVTMVIGILGTILGFYFGLHTSEKSRQPRD